MVTHDLFHLFKGSLAGAMTGVEHGSVFHQLLCQLGDDPGIFAGLLRMMVQVESADDHIGIASLGLAERLDDIQDPTMGAPGDKDEQIPLPDDQVLFMAEIIGHGLAMGSLQQMAVTGWHQCSPGDPGKETQFIIDDPAITGKDQSIPLQQGPVQPDVT